jgi:DNA-binding response OmpR family regulator
VKRILLAEDDEILRMLITDTLEDEEYQVDEAKDGQEAVEFLETKPYELVIIDYMMPAYSGVEVIEKVRQGDLNKDVTILMLSAKSQQSEQEKAIFAGADFFIAKPFSPLDLLDKVRGILHEKNENQ